MSGREWLWRMLRSGEVEARVARRAVAMWLLARLVVAFLLALGGEPAIALDPKASVIAVALVGFLTMRRTRQQNEHLLLANLGTPRSAILTLVLMPPLALEFVAAALGQP